MRVGIDQVSHLAHGLGVSRECVDHDLDNAHGADARGVVKLNLVRAVLDRTSLMKPGLGVVSALLARYNDAFVGPLKRWEAHTRDVGGHMGCLRADVGLLDGKDLRKVFYDWETWDNTKMVHITSLVYIQEN
ncbi:hypothetical protein B0H15DRAFT_376678 [Mycena belliarum]|uniref:Uncharacterized protein n=1 Tax=Mycena belliarum TaxID=1033014 RepID=A0AAD6U2F4_9AGAR|nr:hypothetical protein B0H15DRAFT_376678 [Mycena belliae]